MATKMKTSRKTLLVQVALFGLATGCSQSSSDPAATPATNAAGSGTSSSSGSNGVEVSTSNTLSIAGTLALDTYSLTDAKKGVLMFTTYGGKMTGDPKKVEVDADGKFSVSFERNLEAVETLVAFAEKARADRVDADFEAAAVALQAIGMKMTAAGLKSVAEDEIQEGVGSIASQMKGQGAISLLVAYDISESGDKAAEASSFRFIGLPTAGGHNLSAISATDLAGNLDLGSIAQSGGDAVSTLPADSTSFNLSDDAINSYASAGEALKAVKNAYMNDNWGAAPFYVWNNASSMSEVVNEYGNVATLTYHGYGFYVGSNYAEDAPFTYTEVCGSDAVPVPTKAVTFTPPSSIHEKNDQGVLGAAITAYSNASVSRDMQGSSKVCYGNGIYIREDQREHLSFMLNFGTGGSIVENPAGLWKLGLGGTEVGRFDLKSASPIDADGKPVIFMPSVKFIVANGNVTGAEVQFKRWNGTAYEDMSDLGPIKRLVSVMSASVSKTSDNSEVRTGDEGMFTETDNASFKKDLDSPVPLSDAKSLSFFYKIGDASYRLEYRDR